MQISSAELIISFGIILALVFFIILLIVFGFHGARPSSPTDSSAYRQRQRTKNGQADGEDPGNEGPESARTQEETPKASSAKDPYVILNIPSNATQDEVMTAYRKMAQMYHPDKVAGLAPEYREIADERMKDINAAYERIQRKFEAER